MKTRVRETIYDIPTLNLPLLQVCDRSYEIGRVGKSVEECFHLHYFLSYYCHTAQSGSIDINQVPIQNHYKESIEAHELLLLNFGGL
jgi:hypothetical protein